MVDAMGRYAGIVTTADAYNPDLDKDLGQPVDALKTGADQFLLPEQNVRTALRRFGSAKAETLAVVNDGKALHVVGFMTEGYALRRYNQELERSRAEEVGEHSLYGPA
jgi:CIC family chloride channel protein